MGVADLLGFVAGIGIFLFAMQQMEGALHTIGGKRLSNMLHSATDSSFGSVLSGTFATAILQSSSMVGLMVLAMVGSGILPLANGVGMVVGANLGTTITGWLVTIIGFKLDLSSLAIPAMGIGAIYSFFNSKNSKQKGLGLLFFAIGLLIFGLDTMKSSVADLAEKFEPAKYVDMHSIVFLLMGIAFTAVIQSSSATMMITLSALNADLLTIPAAAAIIVGADLGTTSTMLIGGLQGSSNKKRVAISHVIFNLATAFTAYVLLLPLLPWMLNLVGLTDPLISVVAFHSFFNLLGVVVVFPFLKYFSNYLSRLFQEQPQPLCQFIHDVPAEHSKVAWIAVEQEIIRLWEKVLFLNSKVLSIKGNYHQNADIFPNDVKGYSQQYAHTKALSGAIMEFLLDIQYQSGAHPMVKQGGDRLLKTVRKLNYAMKSAKDIREDLSKFDPSIAKKIIKVRSRRTASEKGNLKKLDQMIHFPSAEEWDEEFDDMIMNASFHHDDFVSHLYEMTQQDFLDSQQLATLINVSKHIQEGVHLLAESVHYLQQARTSLRLNEK